MIHDIISSFEWGPMTLYDYNPRIWQHSKLPQTKGPERVRVWFKGQRGEAARFVRAMRTELDRAKGVRDWTGHRRHDPYPQLQPLEVKFILVHIWPLEIEPGEGSMGAWELTLRGDLHFRFVGTITAGKLALQDALDQACCGGARLID